MTGEAKAPVLTAGRAPQHIRLFETYDAYKRLYSLTVPPSLAPSPRYARRYTASSRLRCHFFRVWVHCRRASNGLLPRRSNLLGYVRWDARSDRFLLARQSFQTAFRSQSALSHKPISLALSREAPRGSLPAFASSDVVEIRRRYLLHYREAFASSLMSCPHRCRSVFRRTFHCTFELPTSRPGWLAGRRRLP